MNWSMGSLAKRAQVRKVEASSDITGIETRSLSSVT